MSKNDRFLEVVAKRLTLTSDAVREKREELNTLESRIKSEVAGMGKVKQNMTYEDVEAKIAELEYNHAHSSLSNAEDRQFMREVDALRKAKKLIKANGEKQLVVDELKAQRVDVAEQLRILRDTEGDLLLGYRRLKLAGTSGVEASSIVERPMEVPEDRVGVIIGKGGSNLRNLESTYNVIIDTERQGGKISIMGTLEAIAAASEAILELVNTVSEELELKESVMTTLLIEKAFLVNELQEELGVKIDIIKAKGVCKVTGHVSQLPEVKQRITSLDCISKKVDLDLMTIPAIIGKGGSTIKRIQADHKVQLDVDRAAGSIVVTGQRPHVSAAAAELSDLYDELREIEDKSISAHRAIIMNAVVGRGGAKIKSLQQDLHVSLQLLKEEEGKEKEGVDQSVETLCIRGNKEQVGAAKTHIMGLIGEFLSESLVFSVSPSTVPAIVGKKGATLNGIREKYPEALVDVSGDSGQIFIHAIDAATREQVKRAIEAIVESNFSVEMQFEEDSLIALKGKRGTEMRALFASYSLNVDMDATTNLVKIKGKEEQVQLAVEACREFLANTMIEKLALTEDGFTILTEQINPTSASSVDKNSEISYDEVSSLKRELEGKFSVEIYVANVDKDKGVDAAYAKVRGSAQSIVGVRETLEAVLAGNGSASSTIVDLHGVPMSSLIGKGGATLKKLQSDLKGARLHLLKKSNQMLIRGPLGMPMESLEEKKRKLLAAVDELRSLVTIVAKDKHESQIISRESSLVSSVFSVDIRQDGNKFLVRGDAVCVEEARQYVTDIISGTAVRSVTLGIVDAASIKRHFEGNGFFTRLRAKFALPADALSITKIESDSEICSIKIRTTSKASEKIRDILRKEAQRLLGEEAFKLIDMNRKVLRSLHGLVFRDSMMKLGLNIELDKVAKVVCITKAVPTADVEAGVALVNAAEQEWNRLNACVDIEEWMIVPIVGKAGAKITALEEQTGVSIKVDRPSLCLDVQAPSEDKLSPAISTIQERLQAIRDGYFEGMLAENKLGAFLGKGGANITALRKSTSATIDVNSKDRTVRITGTPECVIAAKEAVSPFLVPQEAYEEAMRVAAARKEVEESSLISESEKESVSSLSKAPEPAAHLSQPTQPLSKSALKRARQKERNLRQKEADDAKQRAGATAESGEEGNALKEETVPLPREDSSTAVSALLPESAPSLPNGSSVKQNNASTTLPVPAPVPPVAPKGGRNPGSLAPALAKPAAAQTNTMTKVSIAKNLVHSGMSGADIALACQNFSWEGTRQAFIDELETYNCAPDLAKAIADAAGLESSATAGGGNKRGAMATAVKPSAAQSVVQSHSVETKEGVVDVGSLNDDSSTADILDALINMGGGAGFKPTSVTRSATATAVLESTGDRSNPKLPNKQAPAPAPAPAKKTVKTDSTAKPKSAWLGWALGGM